MCPFVHWANWLEKHRKLTPADVASYNSDKLYFNLGIYRWKTEVWIQI